MHVGSASPEGRGENPVVMTLLMINTSQSKLLLLLLFTQTTIQQFTEELVTPTYLLIISCQVKAW